MPKKVNVAYEIDAIILTGEMITRHSGEDFWSMGGYCDLDFLNGIIWELKQNIDLVCKELGIGDEQDYGFRKDDHQKFRAELLEIKRRLADD